MTPAVQEINECYYFNSNCCNQRHIKLTVIVFPDCKQCVKENKVFCVGV